MGDTILLVLDKSKDVQYLTLVNSLDNYVPLVLSVYSIVLKSDNYDQYSHSGSLLDHVHCFTDNSTTRPYSSCYPCFSIGKIMPTPGLRPFVTIL